MKKLVLFAAAILFAAAPLASAAEKTWNGVISDAKCNGKHAKAEHGSQADERPRLRDQVRRGRRRSTCSWPAARPTRSPTRTSPISRPTGATRSR